jgi:hypothetical protein
VQKGWDLCELIVAEDPAPVWHAVIGTAMCHCIHECLIHLVTITVLQGAEIDAPLDHHGARTVAVRAGPVVEFSLLGDIR